MLARFVVLPGNAGAELRRKCARFAEDHGAEIAGACPAIAPGLNDRAGDIGEPLLALAGAAGGKWPERARQTSVGQSASAREDSPSGALLRDILLLSEGCSQLADNFDYSGADYAESPLFSA